MIQIAYGCFACGPTVRDLVPSDTARPWKETACPECGRRVWQEAD